ncbi:hypothetical protein, partial [Paenibacillus sp. tmac-D7]|uniref:hypothetical protein n=1 Tax=Paenibacillus sp. tmac-D7 TaxID=2591462 RepID=UPI001C642ADD
VYVNPSLLPSVTAPERRPRPEALLRHRCCLRSHRLTPCRPASSADVRGALGPRLRPPAAPKRGWRVRLAAPAGYSPQERGLRRFPPSQRRQCQLVLLR